MMKRNFFNSIIVVPFLISVGIFSACRPARYLQENQYLLVKNKIVTDSKKAAKNDIKNYIHQKPNRKTMLFFRFHLLVYNTALKKRQKAPLETKAGGKIEEIVGEPPVILDTLMTERSLKQIRLLMQSKGFFHSAVTDTIIYKKPGRKGGGKAKVKYFIKSGDPFTLSDVIIAAKNNHIQSLIKSDSANAVLKPYMKYDEDLLLKERDRITKLVKNEGYYNFIKEYIYYQADTTIEKNKAAVIIGVDNPQGRSIKDSLAIPEHERYKISRVYINTDYNSKQTGDIQNDTILYDDYYFIHPGAHGYKYRTVAQKIFIKKGDLFQQSKTEDSYKQLAGLQVFKFINISFVDITKQTGEKDSLGFWLLDCMIQLTPMPYKSFSVETEGTHSSGNLGITGNIVYRNKNTFRGAEQFEVKLKGALEAQKTITSTDGANNKSIFEFNTIEIGPEARLIIPKFLLPVDAKKIPKRFNPGTSVSMIYNYQKRPDYTRTIAKASFGYEWNESEYKRHIFNPVELNVIDVADNSVILTKLDAVTNAVLLNSYQDHLIASTRYTYIFNSQNNQLNKPVNFMYFRNNFELSGNFLRFVNKIFNTPDSTGSFRMFNQGDPYKGIRFAQYIRWDVDFRYYFIFDKQKSVVLRTAAGIGIPYINLGVLPFEKSFFAGGANSIRAWQSRKLGPGSYNDATDFGQSGDIKLEGNIEYRFAITNVFHGAAFMDAGNIWLVKKDPAREGAEFIGKNFISEIAVGAGIGLRLNFNFFIVRLDAATPLKDPALEPGNRWFKKQPVELNLGIGYPF